MSYPEPRRFTVHPATGQLEGSEATYQKQLSDLEGLYRDSEAFNALAAERGAEVVYEVQDFRPSQQPGDMIVGVTRMSPGRVGREYFMTRGHIHARSDRPEVYYGQSGRGVMLMEAPDGQTRVIEIAPQTVCYVPPYWIHRSVNTGEEDFVMVFAYPADAGQDYEIIRRSGGMRSLIVHDEEHGWREEPNPDWVPRSREQVESVHAVGGPQ